jgi:AraC-like DNA-binding protein/tetratricopeptide (TPR) repeat protein
MKVFIFLTYGLLLFNIPLTSKAGKIDNQLIDSKIDVYEKMQTNDLVLKLKSENGAGKIAISYILGKRAFMAGEYSSAFDYFNNTLVEFQNIVPELFAYRFRVNAALSLSKIGKFELANHYFSHAWHWISNRGNKTEHAGLLHDMANNYYHWGKYDSAGMLYHRAENLYKETRETSNLADVYLMLGAIAQQYQLQQVAFEYYQMAYPLGKGSEAHETETNLLINMGVVKSEMEDYQQAALYLQEAYRKSRELNSTDGQINALNQIASLFARMGNNKKALEQIETSLKLLENHDDKHLQLKVFYNAATVYKLLLDYGKAIDYLQKADEIQESIGIQKLNTSLALAEIFKVNADYKNALVYLEKAKDFIHATNKNHEIFWVYFIQAEIYLKQKQPARAEGLLLYVLESVGKLDLDAFNELKSGVYLRLADLYTAANNAKKAIEYYKAYENLKSKMLEKAYNFGLCKIQNESDLIKKQAENDVLQIQNEKSQSEISNKNRLLAILLSASLLFVLLSAALGYLYMYKNRLNKELVKRNLELVRQIPFQEEKSKLNEWIDTDQEKPKKIIVDLLHLFENEKTYLDNEVNLVQVATLLNTNRTYLSTAIRDLLQTNFTALINKYRIEESRKMLSDPNQKLSIEGIALKVGFSSKSTFNAAFKAYTGLTPSDLRKEVVKAFRAG